jgi:hypothetical protein
LLRQQQQPQSRLGTTIHSTTPATTSYDNRRASGGRSSYSASFGNGTQQEPHLRRTKTDNANLTAMIENDFEGLLQRTLTEQVGKQPPGMFIDYNLGIF